MNLKHFIGKNQMSCLRDACHGEEGEYFRAMIQDLKKTIAAMPKTYDTEGQKDKTITLHYFKGASDWWIIERDMECEQHQAFGYACLNQDTQNAELGYISIEELIAHNVELDLYYTLETLNQLKARIGR